MQPEHMQAIATILLSLLLLLQDFISQRSRSCQTGDVRLPVLRRRAPTALLSQPAQFPLILAWVSAEINHLLMELAAERPSTFYVKPRSEDWWNHYVRATRGDDARFKEVFRLPLSLLQNLCTLLHDQLQQGPIPAPLATISSRLISVEKHVAVGVLRLASGTRLFEISEHFGLGKSTISKIVNEFLDALLKHRKTFLSFPTNAAVLQRIKRGFEMHRGLPNCCGAIDVTHIVMDKPHNESAIAWYDKNKNYSMCLQAIVDMNMRFLDVYAGWPGSTNDARVFRNSSFYHCVERGIYLAGQPFVNGNFHMPEYIVADCNYGLRTWVMVPYETPRTEEQKLFNFKLSSTQTVVERAFERLKQRWQYLNGKISNPDLKYVSKALVACCILHNLLLREEDGVEDEDNEVGEDALVLSPNPRPRNPMELRNQLAVYLRG